MHKLCEQYLENVNLTVLDDTDVVYLEVIESPQRVKLAAASGQRLPAFCTASGKAILAFMKKEDVIGILKRGMPRYTKNTILDQEKYFENIQIARERGFAISEQVFEEGINAIAAPILTSNGNPIASISIAGPAYRLSRERMMEIGPDFVSQIKELAQDVELATNLD